MAASDELRNIIATAMCDSLNPSHLDWSGRYEAPPCKQCRDDAEPVRDAILANPDVVLRALGGRVEWGSDDEAVWQVTVWKEQG